MRLQKKFFQQKICKNRTMFEVQLLVFLSIVVTDDFKDNWIVVVEGIWILKKCISSKKELMGKL